jgi:hypothetical protein
VGKGTRNGLACGPICQVYYYPVSVQKNVIKKTKIKKGPRLIYDEDWRRRRERKGERGKGGKEHTELRQAKIRSLKIALYEKNQQYIY